jgi:hypothetical protein
MGGNHMAGDPRSAPSLTRRANTRRPVSRPSAVLLEGKDPPGLASVCCFLTVVARHMWRSAVTENAPRYGIEDGRVHEKQSPPRKWPPLLPALRAGQLSELLISSTALDCFLPPPLLLRVARRRATASTVAGRK